MAMLEGLALWEQLDSHGKLARQVSPVKEATQALLDNLNRLVLQVKKKTKVIQQLQGKQLILVLQCSKGKKKRMKILVLVQLLG